MFKRILVCTTLDDGLDRLARFAVPSLAAGGIERVTFLCVVPLLTDREIPCEDTEGLERARAHLSPALDNVPANLDVRVDVRSGVPEDTIVSVAAETESELLVLGTARRTLLSEKLFGSTTIALSERANLPLLILRPELVSTYTLEELDSRCRHLFRYLLLPWDGSERSEFLIQSTVERIRATQAVQMEQGPQQCLLYRVFKEGGRRQQPTEADLAAARDQLQKAGQPLADLGVEVKVEAIVGDPLSRLIEAAQEFDISTIASASNRRNRLFDWSAPDPTSVRILRKSMHPVLYFPMP